VGKKKNRLFTLGFIMAAVAVALAFKAAPEARANIDPFGSLFCLLPNPANPAHKLCEPVSSQLNILKTVLNPHPPVGPSGFPEYQDGDLVQYVITVGNESGSAINFGRVKDVYPPELSYTPNTNDPNAHPSPAYNLSGLGLPSDSLDNHLLRYWYGSDADNPPGSNCKPDAPCLIDNPCPTPPATLPGSVKLCYTYTPATNELAIVANGSGLTVPASKILFIGVSFEVSP